MPPTAAHPPRDLPLTSPIEIAGFVHDLVADVRQYDGVDRRSEPRFAVCVPVEVIPYGGEPIAPHVKFVAVVRDISASGITFLHTSAVREKYWLLEFVRPRAKGIRLVVEVLYRRPIGPLWEIAGRFVVEPGAEPSNGGSAGCNLPG